MQTEAQHHIAAESSDWTSAMCVLALVIQHPDDAYTNGICRRFEASYDHLLPMTSTRVKQLLARTVSERLVDRRDREGEGPFGRQFYFGTALGARTYRAWLARASALDDFGLRVRLATCREDERALALVIDSVYQSSTAALQQPPRRTMDAPIDLHLINDMERRRHQAGVGWAAAASVLLKEGQRWHS